MAQQGGVRHGIQQNDLYTVWLIIASGLLLIGTVYLAVRASQLFGTVWPPAGG